MTLPLADSPWCLSPDDVFGYRLANVRFQRFADTKQALGVEHLNGETDAGEHNSVQIARAVYAFKMPKYDSVSPWYNSSAPTDGYPTDIILRAFGPCVGWSVSPTLRSSSQSEGGAAETYYFIDAVVPGDIFGLSFTPVWGQTPNLDSLQMRSMLPRKCLVDSTVGMAQVGLGGGAFVMRPKAVRVWLGPWDSISKLKGGTLFVHAVPP